MARKFTFTQFLVLCVVVVVLLGVTLGVLSKMRQENYQIVCIANLNQIGTELGEYLNDSKGLLPRINCMPSIQPPFNDGPSIAGLLKPYGKGQGQIFHCPADSIRVYPIIAPKGYSTYFEREGTSYGYDPKLSADFNGKELTEDPMVHMGGTAQVVVMSDFEPFHGWASASGKGSNCLYADLHVGDSPMLPP